MAITNASVHIHLIKQQLVSKHIMSQCIEHIWICIILQATINLNEIEKCRISKLYCTKFMEGIENIEKHGNIHIFDELFDCTAEMSQPVQHPVQVCVLKV